MSTQGPWGTHHLTKSEDSRTGWNPQEGQHRDSSQSSQKRNGPTSSPKTLASSAEKPGHISRNCHSPQQANPTPENARAGGSTPTADATTPESRQAHYNELGGLEGIYNLVKDGPEEDKEKFVDMVQDF